MVIPDRVISFGDYAFKNNKLTSVVIPDSVAYIESNAFEGNPLELISISLSAPFPITVFPEGVLIDYRGLNQSPKDISPSSSIFDENIEGGSAVATLITTDPDAGDTHAYSLINGEGDADNGAFVIDGNQLKIVESPDFEERNSYSIRLQTKDSGGLTFEKVFMLSVNDLEEVPAEIYELPSTNNGIGGTKQDDVISGTDQDDYIFGKKGDDILEGLNGDDLIRGGGGHDMLKGSDGNDFLNGSKGRDILIGGAGSDVFKNSKGIDLVQDFSIQQGDRIALPKSGKYKVVDDEEGVLITSRSNRSILLSNLEYSDAIAAGINLFVQPA